MLVPKKIKGSKRFILIGIIILALGIIGYLVYTNLLPAGHTAKTGNKKINQPVTTLKIDLKFTDDFLKKAPYTQLRAHSQLPVTVVQVGREDPFMQLPFSLLRF